MQRFKNKKFIITVLVILAVIIGAASLSSYIRNRRIRKQQEIDALLGAQQEAKKTVPVYMYGLRVDPFTVEEKIIGKGQIFADMVSPFGITFDEVFALVQQAKPFFNVRQFAQGKPYRVVYEEKDTTNVLKYLVYEASPVQFVIFDFSERPANKVYEGRKEMKIIRRLAAGTVTSSLFGSMTENNLSAQTAVELAEIFASSIDFYRVHKGDYYKLVFEEKVVDGESVGIEKIIAAQFNHEGQNYFGFRYEADGKASYFDEKGNSQRKAFLKSPLKFGRLTSGYTQRRFHPVQKRFKAHLGTDYAAPKGTPIMTIGDGVIQEARYSTFNGNYVKVKHSSNVITQYLHMSRFGAGIRPGKKVSQGQVIGYVGSTGLSTGPHVCFRYWKNGTQVNHLKEKFATYTPVNPKSKAEYMKMKDALMEELNSIDMKEPSDDSGTAE
ncbi:MAG: peptidoglycan DD-metalloendopeptidase family protein [Bacteroidota bacterium]